MRCFKCGSFSLFVFCKVCKKILSEPTLGVRKFKNFNVYHFYNYSEIKELIYSKHSLYGSAIFRALARLSFSKIARNLELQTDVYALPIDDKNENGYSHTAILAKACKSDKISVLYHALHASNDVKYSGKDLKFRQKNPRNFKLLKNINKPVILIDDIVTTGSTLLQAKQICEKNKIPVVCAIVLADATY